MKRRPDSMNSRNKAPNSLIRSLASFAVVTIAVLSYLVIRANTDTGTLHIIGYVLTFSGILGIGVIKYRQYKHGFYYTAIAAVVTAIGAGILVSAFFDWLY